MVTFSVKTIACSARRWAEETNRLLGMPYSADLGGMCAVASGYLLQRLHEAGHTKALAVENDEHCFVMIDRHVIDITATQFGVSEPVMIRAFSRCQKRWWRVDHTSRTATALRRYQMQVGWPPGQTCPLWAIKPTQKRWDAWKRVIDEHGVY